MSIYEIITNGIVEEIEKNNILPWKKEWSCRLPVNHCTQRQYRDINLLLLPQTASNEFITWSQLSALREKDGSLKFNVTTKKRIIYWNTALFKIEFWGVFTSQYKYYVDVL